MPEYIEEKGIQHLGTTCPCCDTKLKPCPFCGSKAVIFAQNMVGCIEVTNCGGEIDFGHWCGTDDEGTPAEHHVIEQWNKRA